MEKTSVHDELLTDDVAERRLAERAAASAPGLKRVENELVVA